MRRCSPSATSASFPAADEDYFAAMDNGAKLNADEVKGRNMWLVWTGGNDRFWDELIKDLFGTFDLLKTISSAPGLPYSRDNRWKYFGVVNEPCFDKADRARSQALRPVARQARRADCPPDPFANAKKYPGVADRRARHGRTPRRLLLRRADGHRRAAAVPNPASTPRRGASGMPERYYNDPELLP